jgi:fatty-acyl-CoA synthase
MAEQADMSPKWVPGFVRVVAALPVTATNKLDKKPLRAERWRTSDPVYRRVERTMEFALMGPQEAMALEDEFVTNGRANLLA